MSEEQKPDKGTDPEAETLKSADTPSQTRGPKEIGHYKIRRVIGSGGMGTVYEAIQENPRRKVAIKVMRSGVTSRSALRRFEYESQILGRLHHIGIAQVYEAGTWDDGTGGVPYFAMEYIAAAQSLLAYAQKKDLGTDARLRLFEKVSDAVHHGHIKGIIHRDLKPDNILVDQSGNPKIIDFGVARATDSDMAVTTLQTNVGQLVGTVQYMSPEQCEADPDLIDARSDVYSLGVILYELLSGQPPYDLSSIPIYEATRVIRERQPTRMTTVTTGISGDLETIVSKAMDKDRDRRYQSAHELRQDIERFLMNEPIEARRASMVYQFKMFARRNRGVVATAATIAGVLVVATIVSVYSGIRATQAESAAVVERDRAVAAEQQVLGALTEAENARKQAEDATKEATKSFQWMLSIANFSAELLELGAPRNAQGQSLTVHDILLHATDDITVRFSDEPHLEAPLRAVVGKLLWEMGELEVAEAQLQRAVELFETLGRPYEHLRAAIAYAKVLHDLGKYDQSTGVANSVMEQGTTLFGTDHDAVLEAKDIIADNLTITFTGNPLSIRREIIAAIEAGAEVTREFELGVRAAIGIDLLIVNGMSGSTTGTEALTEAKEVIKATIKASEEELGSLHPVTVEARTCQAMIYFQQKQIDKAFAVAEQALVDSRAVFGPGHIQTAQALTGAAFVRIFRGRNGEAVDLFLESIEIMRNVAGEDYPPALSSQLWLANAMIHDGKLEEGEAMIREVLPKMTAAYGAHHPELLNARASLAGALLRQGKFEDGDPLWEEVVAPMRQMAAGELGLPVIQMRMLRAIAYINNSHDQSDEIVDALLEDMASVYGMEDGQTLGNAYYLSTLYIESGRVDRGLSFLAFWMAKGREVIDHLNPSLRELELGLAQAYLDADMPTEAEAIFSRVVPIIAQLHGASEKMTVASQLQWVRSIARQGRGDEAVAMVSALYNRLTEELGEEDEVTRRAETTLINTLVGLDRWNDIDRIMDARMERRQDNADLLLEMAKVIINNGHAGYREHYLDVAMDAATRAAAIRGEDDPLAMATLAEVHFAHGNYDESLNWLAKAIVYAGEDHEKIEDWQGRLEKVRAAAAAEPTP